MSKLRPGLADSKEQALPTDTALFLIRQAVAKRRSLVYGTLHANGLHCAIGCFWEDCPNTTLKSALIDEVAAVNDANRNETPHQRWKRVNEWLKWKVRCLSARGKKS